MAVASTTTTTITTPLSFIHNPVLTDSVTHEIITIRLKRVRVSSATVVGYNIFLSFDALIDYIILLYSKTTVLVLN